MLSPVFNMPHRKLWIIYCITLLKADIQRWLQVYNNPKVTRWLYNAFKQLTGHLEARFLQWVFFQNNSYGNIRTIAFWESVVVHSFLEWYKNQASWFSLIVGSILIPSCFKFCFPNSHIDVQNSWKLAWTWCQRKRKDIKFNRSPSEIRKLHEFHNLWEKPLWPTENCLHPLLDHVPFVWGRWLLRLKFLMNTVSQGEHRIM